jgi:hypothetical protein
VQHDYRRVFGTILQDWFGVNTTTLDLTFYNKTTKSGFANAKIANMIKTQNVVQPSCYNTKALGIDNFEIKDEVLVYPNPTSEIVMIQSTNAINSVSIYAMDGRNINTYRNPLTTNDYSIDVQNFAVGIYTLKVNTDKGSFSKKIIIRR